MASNPVLLITGANNGLGLYTVKSLCRSKRAYTILLSGRNLEKANAAVKEVQQEFPGTLSTITCMQLDIEDDDSISEGLKFISNQYGRLDILINNAGASFDQQLSAKPESMSMREMWNKSWDVNITGTQVLTHALVPLLLKSSDPRLLFLASGTSSMGEHDNLGYFFNRSPAKGWPKPERSVMAYRSSKAGLNMMMREWYRILKEDGVKVWAISPGFLATGLGGDQEANKKMGALDPTIGADFITDVVEGKRDQDIGKVIRRTEVQPW